MKYVDIDAVNSDVTVCYGKTTNRENTRDNVIFNDDDNNFEIVLSQKGSCKIRRL